VGELAATAVELPMRHQNFNRVTATVPLVILGDSKTALTSERLSIAGLQPVLLEHRNSTSHL
jgi:hypothetical protein